MIRRYQMEDIPSIVSLEEKSLGTTLGAEMLESQLSNPMSFYYVYEDKGRISGYISLSFDGFTGEILNFCVDESVRNQGLGTALLSHAIDELYAKGAESFILEVRETNLGAIRLYERLGFRKISVRKNYYSNGENASVYQKVMVPYMDMEEAYNEVFSRRTVHEDYTEYEALDNPKKYYANFYLVREPNDSLMDKLKKSRHDFVQVETGKKYEGVVSFASGTELIEYHTNLRNIRILEDHSCRIEKLDESNRDLFEAFIYVDSLPFGAEYARENAKAMVKAGLGGRTTWYLVYADDMIIGAVNVFVFADAAKLEDFFILEEYQHKGYGSALVGYVLGELKSRGIHDIYVTAEEYDTPKEMYEKMGFYPAGRRYIVREVYK